MDSKKILIIVLILAFSIRMFLSFTTLLKGWDETVYANLGWNLKSNPFNYEFKYWGDKNLDECWSCAGFRAPLLPYSIMILYSVFGNSEIILNLFMPIIGTIGIVLLYLLAKRMFNEKIALVSAIILAFLPLHVMFSGKFLTDVYATTLITVTSLFFWLGFIENKFKFKLLFGLFLALSFLARYISVVMVPVYLLLMLIRERNFRFLTQKGTVLSFVIFFLVISPWLLYSYNEYNNPIGFLLHAKNAASYWGDTQPWYFFFQHSFESYSIFIIPFIFGLFDSIRKMNLKKFNYLLILFWILAILGFSIYFNHKEERFLLTLTPAFSILAAIGIYKILDVKNRKLKIISSIFMVIVCIVVIISLIVISLIGLKNIYTEKDFCILNSTKLLKGTENNSIIFTELSSVIYHYTHKENHFLTHGFEDIDTLIKENYIGRPVYALWIKDDTPQYIKDGLDANKNFKPIYKCPNEGLELVVVCNYSINS